MQGGYRNVVALIKPYRSKQAVSICYNAIAAYKFYTDF